MLSVRLVSVCACMCAECVAYSAGSGRTIIKVEQFGNIQTDSPRSSRMAVHAAHVLFSVYSADIHIYAKAKQSINMYLVMVVMPFAAST